jgi:hypothetical protein
MENFREFLEIEGFKILSESKTKDGDTLTFLASFGRLGVQTLNKRKYPPALMKRELKRLQPTIESGGFIGMGDHGSTAHATISDASHIVKRMWVDEDNRGWAEIKVLPTEKGKNVIALIKGGATLGLSTKGTGSVNPTTFEVEDDFRLTGLDIVTMPAAQGATFDKSNVYESVDFEEQTRSNQLARKEGSSEKFIQMLMEGCYGRDIRERFFSGSYEEWLRKNEANYRANIAVQDGLYPDVETALREMGHFEEARAYSPVREKKYTIAEIQGEALQAGIDPQKYCEMLNKNLEEREAHKATGYTLEERQDIYQQAALAGADISTPESRKKVLEQYSKPIKTPDDELTEEAERFIENYKKENPGSNVTLEMARQMIQKEREQKAEEERKKNQIHFFVRESLIAGPPRLLTPEEERVREIHKRIKEE